MLKGLVFHEGPSLAESEEKEREIGKAYRRDKVGRLQAIWLIRLRDSNPVDSRRCRRTVYPTAFVVYQAKKREPRLSSEKSDVCYIGAMPGKLGFFRRNSVELRKGGFPFIHEIDDTCTRMLLSSYLFPLLLLVPPLSTLHPRFPCFVSFFILFFVFIYCVSLR